MSKLEELIQQYCPDGVEYVRLGDVLSVNRGKRLTKTQLSDDGKYFVYHGSKDTPLGKYSQFNVKGKTTIVVNTGGIGGVKFCDENFWCSDGSFWIGHSSLLNDKYVYYYLSPKESYFASQKRVGGVPTIDRSTVENVEIPVPPLPVQEEIVRILDAFTELQAELQAELQKRKQQYSYYLDNLLNFNNINRGGYQAEVRWMKIGDICDVFTGGEVPMGSIKGNTSFGSFIYPIWGNGKDIYGYATTYQIDKDAVCISSIGANSGAVFFHKAYFTPIIRLKVLIPRNQGISVRYLFYILSFVGFDVKKSSVPNMNSNEVKQKVIPIPSLVEQQRIVSILDRFDTLTTDLTQGLPAEIEKRRQQYEYYRDKLLTFKRKGA